MHYLHKKKYFFYTEKNSKLIKDCDIGFEEIINAISAGDVLDFKANVNQEKYPNQDIIYVQISGESFIAPYAQQDEESIFLKTIYPSRRARKEYLPNNKISK